MTTMFAYVRVSTQKQGKGVSLEQQKASIMQHASSNGIHISEWFEETKTAAKQGRPAFNELLTRLKKGEADGVIIHKIDRSARNLRDWVDLGDLIDQGIKIQFAHDNIDLTARGGRLSADIQAIIAADYIRNLREETKKGIYGRLKQGVYPFNAPVGYLNTGSGKVKTLDPVKAPLVKKAFKLYATGDYSLILLGKTLREIGLTNVKNQPFCKSGISRMLRNPYYMGIIRIKITGEAYPGKHKPLISTKLYNQVQDVLDGKISQKKQKHRHLFSNMLKCKLCNYFMPGELQKGTVYYRCHTKSCDTKCIREDRVNQIIALLIEHLDIKKILVTAVREVLKNENKNHQSETASIKKALVLENHSNKKRLSSLTDLLIDGTLSKEDYVIKKGEILLKISEVSEKLASLGAKLSNCQIKADRILEPCKALYLSYFEGNKDKKREILKNLSSNLFVEGKEPMVELNYPYNKLVNVLTVSSCTHHRTDPRTFSGDCSICTRAKIKSKSSSVNKRAEEVVRILLADDEG